MPQLDQPLALPLAVALALELALRLAVASVSLPRQVTPATALRLGVTATASDTASGGTSTEVDSAEIQLS